jgi:transposase
LFYNSYGIINLLRKEEFVFARLIRTEHLPAQEQGGFFMSEVIVGVDIAKRKFDVALFMNGKFKHKTCLNTMQGFEELSQWLKKQAVERVHVCMEATGTYGDELATYMHDAGHTVSIVNPARIKGFAQSELLRTKNDKIDAALIARFCIAMNPEIWTPPPEEIRRLQLLVRRADALIVMRTQEQNRLGTADGTMEASISEHISYLDQEIDKLRRQIAEHINSDPNLRTKRDLLSSIPGIGEATIAVILSALHIFEGVAHVQKTVAFIGLAPREIVSGSSVKGKARICKMGHSRLRKALFMPALVSMRYNPVMVDFCNRLRRKGKNGKVIICAVMRKLVHVIYGILKSGKPFDPNYKLNVA